VDSQGAAAAVVHESVVALIELFARQLTGSSAQSRNTDMGCHMDGFLGRFSTCGCTAAVVVTWHSCCSGVHELSSAQLTQLRTLCLLWGNEATY
jgi:hypothetical protein